VKGRSTFEAICGDAPPSYAPLVCGRRCRRTLTAIRPGFKYRGSVVRGGSRAGTSVRQFDLTRMENGEGSGVFAPNPSFSKYPLGYLSRYQPACKPGFVGHRLLAQVIRDGHSSGTKFAHGLEQPTRTASLTSPCGVFAFTNSPRCRPYSVLLPVWFAMPFPLPDPRCALTAPFHPYFLRRGSGSFSVALSLGSPPPDVIRHRMSMEPGLSSPAAFRP
jgi:hypothetical protein